MKPSLEDLPILPEEVDEEIWEKIKELRSTKLVDFRRCKDKIKAVHVKGNIVYILSENMKRVKTFDSDQWISTQKLKYTLMDRKTGKSKEILIQEPRWFRSFERYHKAVSGFERRVEKFKRLNEEDIGSKISDIRIFQTQEGEAGRPFTLVDTNSPETFIKANDNWRLRIHAYRLGADALICYQPVSSIATPIKYK